MAKTLLDRVKDFWNRTPAAAFSTQLAALAQLRATRFRSHAYPARETERAASSHPADVERRPLSVLFCDMVGSTQLSRRLDPEDLRNLLTQYHDVVREEIRKQGGHTAQLLGDGVLAYFGWPQAHEDDPVRAVRAGLGILHACSELSLRVRPHLQSELQVRVGIHSGIVVLGEMGARGSGDFLAVGEVPNVASKAQSAAPPQAVVVTEATWRLTRGQFDFVNLNAVDVDVPFQLYSVGGESLYRTRLDWSDSLTRFVDRHDELIELEAIWRRTLVGQRTAMLVSGEPGTGKSRLVREFSKRILSANVLECTCLARLQNSPFYPLIDMLERQIGINRREHRDRNLERLKSWLSSASVSDPDSLSVLRALLTLNEPSAAEAVATSAIKQRRATLETLLRVLLQQRSAPTVLIVEDVQWADPSTLEFIELVLKSPMPAGIMVLMTAREVNPQLSAWSNVSTLDLPALNTEYSRSLVSALTGDGPVQRELLNFLVDHSNGLPLYIEELTRHLLDTNLLIRTQAGYELRCALSDISVPTSMQAFLTERLDHLGQSRQLIQVASVIGMKFDTATVAHVMQRPISDVERSLRATARAGVVLQVDANQYVFRHALLRDAGYNMLSRERKREYHAAVAKVLLRAEPETLSAKQEVLAYHYAGAGDMRQAAVHWLAAGQGAIARHAVLEAMDAFNKGLECTTTLPASRETDAVEVDLLTGLGFTYIATKGFSAQEVEDIFTRARDMCAIASGPPPMRILFGIWAVYIVRGDPGPVTELARSLRAIAEAPETPADERLIAHACLGTLNFHLGDPTATRYHCEQGMALCDRTSVREQNHRLITTHGYDGLLYSHLFLAWTMVHLDEPDRAHSILAEALEIAKQLGSPFCAAMVAAFAASIMRDLRAPALAREHAQRAIALSLEYGYPFWLAAGLFADGWAESQLGDPAKALSQIQQGLAVYSQIGARISKPYYLSYLVEVHMRDGKLDDADQCADSALEISDATVGCHYEPELLRLKAEIAFRQRRPEAARAYLARASTQARALGLKDVQREIDALTREHTVERPV